MVADGDLELARSTAERLGRKFYSIRHHIVPDYPDLDTGLTAALAAKMPPAVLADMSDNTGAGAPGDSTRVCGKCWTETTDVASGFYFDPVAVELCEDAVKAAG